MKEIDKDGENIISEGVPYYKFDCGYIMPDGTEWSFHIYAKDWKEADLRIKQIKLTVRNGGQTIQTIPTGGN